MIEYRGVSKRFGELLVLNKINLRIEKGEIFFILGRTGVGKTVLIRLLVGLIKPDEGEIYFEGERIDNLDEEGFQRIRRRCGMVFQFPTLFDSLNIFENIAFCLRRFESLDEESLRVRVKELLSMVHLGEDVMELFPQELSYGMQKRVSMARTIALKPSCLVYDEPTTGLDPITARQVNELILELREKLGVTTLVVSHDLESMRKIADRTGLLEGGDFIVICTPWDFMNSSHPFVQKFVRAELG